MKWNVTRVLAYNNNPTYFSHKVAISDLPESYDPGCFFILLPGVFISQKNFTSLDFSGLCMYGGTAPTAPIKEYLV